MNERKPETPIGAFIDNLLEGQPPAIPAGILAVLVALAGGFNFLALLAAAASGLLVHHLLLKHDDTLRSLRETGEQLAASKDLLGRESMVDSFTGLYGRRVLDEMLLYEFNRCMRIGQRLSIAVLDIDKLELINSSHGRSAGDAALKQVAARLQDASRDSDILCYAGEDEFALLMPGTKGSDGIRACERLRSQLDTAVATPAGDLEVRLSAGIAEAVPEDSHDSLLERARAAVNTAKEAGRDQVTIADPPAEADLDI